MRQNYLIKTCADNECKEEFGTYDEKMIFCERCRRKHNHFGSDEDIGILNEQIEVAEHYMEVFLTFKYTTAALATRQLKKLRKKKLVYDGNILTTHSKLDNKGKVVKKLKKDLNEVLNSDVVQGGFRKIEESDLQIHHEVKLKKLVNITEIKGYELIC